MFDKYKDWKDIKMPGDMKNDILISMQEYKPAKKKMTRRKRTIIIAAVLSVVMVMSVVAISNYSEMTLIDLEGNMSTILFPERSVNEEEWKFESEIWSETDENTVFYVIRNESSISHRMPGIKIEDYEELKDYLKDFEEEIYKLPQYIPNGYTFKEATINFYLSENINYDELEPIYYEEKFGNIYEEYELPELSGKISDVRIMYTKDSEWIQYAIHFTSPYATEFGGSSFPVSVEPELLDIAQFDNSMIVAYELEKKEQWNLTAMKDGKPFNALSPTMACKTWRNKNINMGEDYFNHELGKAVYKILEYADISRDEIIKMAESIK